MELRTYPDRILSRKCVEVKKGDAEVAGILQEMSQKLYEWEGAGLAAPQVGILKRIVVIDIREEPHQLYKMINPKIIWASEDMIESHEGCLSLPFLRETVIRHESVTVEYLDENFEKQEIHGTDFMSCCLQHELDHLDGILYVDRLGKLKRASVLRKFRKLRKEMQEQKQENENSRKNGDECINEK